MGLQHYLPQVYLFLHKELIGRWLLEKQAVRFLSELTSLVKKDTPTDPRMVESFHRGIRCSLFLLVFFAKARQSDFRNLLWALCLDLEIGDHMT